MFSLGGGTGLLAGGHAEEGPSLDHVSSATKGQLVCHDCDRFGARL